MKYFTAEEARAIIHNAPLRYCIRSDDNPMLDAMSALYAETTKRGKDVYLAVACAFTFGRAVGTREERARNAERKLNAAEGISYEE